MDVQNLATILIPVDFTEPSLNALDVAVRLSEQQQKVHLHLVYVLNPDTLKPLAPDDLPDLSKSHLTQQGASLIQMLAMLTAQEYPVNCSSSFRVGTYSDEVMAAAQSIHADLIVMGTLVGANSQALRLNSDAYRMIKTAPCPVLTVPAHKKWTTFEQILFPVRPIPGALDKYEFARKIIRKNASELTVLALSNPDEVISISQLQDQITELLGKLAQDGVKSKTLFWPTESIAETVLDKCVELSADMLVITASLGATANDFLIGTFVQQIVYNAQIPVLFIRPDSGLSQHTTPVQWRFGVTDSGFTTIGL
ncbi:universal stress protein [Spirosoma sp. SC4-14]|uniref:universal stress protein n=1 Tax=Spirosoma sp. SC4-14 TaxID=3128900 RepID=UPI0030CB982B